MRKRLPEILMGIGIAGMLITSVLTANATPKAMRLIEERKKEVADEKLPATDIVKTVWKCYIPAAVVGSVSVICLIGARSVYIRRAAVLFAVYELSEAARKVYQDKTLEVVGKQREASVRDSVAKDIIERNPIKNDDIIVTGKGNTLFYDVIGKRYFLHDIEMLRRAQHDLNQKMMNHTPTYISLNDFYYKIGLAPVDIGDDVFWSVKNDRTDNRIDLTFSVRYTQYGTRCTVFSFRNPPIYIQE